MKLNELIESLNVKGIRECALKNSLIKHLPEILSSLKYRMMVT
jgi:hypothetical protein